MKISLPIMTVLLAAHMSWAQSVEDELNRELDTLYSQQNKGAAIPVTGNTEVVNVPESRISPVVTQSQPVYVIQQSAPAVQKQPTTHIESSPLKKSRADEMREARQETEMNTETRIVEKLEQSRMEDEKKRADVLFGDRFNKLNNSNSEAQAQQAPQAAAPAPVIQVIQAPPVQNVEEVEKPSMREEIRAALSDVQATDDSSNYLEPKTYVGAILGLGEYPSASNVKGEYAIGFNVGTKFKDRIVVEGSFLYSKYQVERVYGGYAPNTYNYYSNNALSTSMIDMDQYTGSVAVKAQMFSGMLRPVLGGLLAYSYRQYHENYFNVDSTSSQAIDVGVLAGADFDLTDEFSVGLDFRYMWNLSNRSESNNSILLSNYGGKKVEEFNYYILSLVGKMSF